MGIKEGLFVLFLTFLTLKLTGYIAWTWWWVTAPLWLGFVVWASVAGAIVLFMYKWGRK